MLTGQFRVDVSTVALLAGPLVLAGYLAGSLPIARWIIGTGADRPRSDDEPIDRREVLTAAIQGLIPLLAATATWRIIERVAPGGLGGFASVSPIAFLSNQAITVWQSMALWTGAAALVGHVAPVWRRFEAGGSGVPAAVALSIAYGPTIFAGGAFGYLAVMMLTRSRTAALYGALAMSITVAWLGWVFAWNAGWGNNHGPEMALWIAVLCGTMVVAEVRRVGRTV